MGTERYLPRYQVNAFGDLVSSEPTPVVQVDGLYGVLDTDLETFTATGGSIDSTTTPGQIIAKTGTSAGGYGVVRSIRALRYRPGQAARARIAGRFTTGVANSLQFLGLSSAENTLAFAYYGAEFGVLLRTRGLVEIRSLAITAAATGGESVTVTLDGTEYGPIAVTSGTAQHNAFEIATDAVWDTSGWIVWQNDDDVYFLSGTVGARSGTYAVSSGGTLTGSYTQRQAGAANSDTFVSLDEWDFEPYRGFDPTKGNVYEISFGWLGHAPIEFRVLDPVRGYYRSVHTLRVANESTAPSFNNPNMQIGCIAASLGSTTALECAFNSLAGFVDGPRSWFRDPRSTLAETLGVGSTLTNILTVRNAQAFNGRVNFGDVYPQWASFTASSASGTRPVQFYVIKNATLAGEPNWQWIDNGHSRVEVDTSGTTVTGGDKIDSVSTTSSGEREMSWGQNQMVLAPYETLTLAALRTSGTTDVAASLRWVED